VTAIRAVPSQVGRTSVTTNFSRAMPRRGDPEIALSDQDDVWVPQKLDAVAAVDFASWEGGAAEA